MPPLVLTPSQLTGNALLDLHHADIVGWTNFAVQRADEPGAQQSLDQAFDGLISTLQLHQAAEELAMSRCSLWAALTCLRGRLRLRCSLSSQ